MQGRGALKQAFSFYVIAMLLAWSDVARAGVRTVLYVEGKGASEVVHDVRRALLPKADSGVSRTFQSLLRGYLGDESLSHALGSEEAARRLTESVRRALGKTAWDLAVLIALEPGDGNVRSVKVLVVPTAEDGPAFLQLVAMPALESRQKRSAWWSRTFTSPDVEPTRIEEPSNEEPPQTEPTASPQSTLPPAGPENVLPESPRATPEVTRRKPSPSPAETRSVRTNFMLRGGGDVSLRSFEDVESGRGAPRTYRALPVPGGFAGLELYSGWLGLEGGFSRSLGVRSTTDRNHNVGTSWTHVEAALKGRLVLGNAERAPWLTLFGGYAYSRFVFDDEPGDSEVPTGVYHVLRGGIDGRGTIRRFVLFGGAEFDRLVLIRFLGNTRPASSGNGITVRGGVAFEIVPRFFARLEARYIWWSFGLVRDVPAHVIDRYATLRAGFEVTF